MTPTIEALAHKHAEQRLNKKRRNAELRRFGYDPDGEDGKRYRAIFHQLLAPQVGEVALWVFPPEDFTAWRDACHRGGPIASHAAYMSQIEQIVRDAQSRGLRVVRREMRVADMLAELKARGWANTSENRSRIIAGESQTVLGLKVNASTIGSALVQGQPAIEHDEERLRQGESHADAARRKMDGE